MHIDGITITIQLPYTRVKLCRIGAYRVIFPLEINGQIVSQFLNFRILSRALAKHKIPLKVVALA